jgi:hypothetical protein
MADIFTSDLLPGLHGNVVEKRLVDMGDGTFAELTMTTLAASTNTVGTVNLGSLGGAATSANQAIGNATLTTLSAPFTAATSTPLTAAISDTATHALGPFTPQLSRQIWLTLNATAAASGTAQLLRSNDGGTTRIGITQSGNIAASYQFSGVTGAIVNEPILAETDATAVYFLMITLTAGSITVRIAQ